MTSCCTWQVCCLEIFGEIATCCRANFYAPEVYLDCFLLWGFGGSIISIAQSVKSLLQGVTW